MDQNPLGFLLRVVDGFLPAGLQSREAAEKLRPRMVIGFGLAISIYFPIFGLTGILLMGAPLTGGVILAAGIPVLFAPLLLKRFGVTPTGHLLAGVLATVIAAVAFVNGVPTATSSSRWRSSPCSPAR